MPTPIGRDKPLPDYVQKEEEKKAALLAEKERREKINSWEQEADRKDEQARDAYWEQEMKNAFQKHLMKGLDRDTALQLAQAEIDEKRAETEGYSR